MDNIRKLWQEHYAAEFPVGNSGEQIDGEDLISLDSYASGCISAFLDFSGTLDMARLNCLIRCRDDLDKVLPKLDGEAKKYYSRLRLLSQLVLQACNYS
jgi:hypothetical protein